MGTLAGGSGVSSGTAAADRAGLAPHAPVNAAATIMAPAVLFVMGMGVGLVSLLCPGQR
jgi:hypothetical protein